MKTKKQIENDGYEVSFTNGTGAGGQKRNRTYSVAIVKHLDSGLVEKCDETREANRNMNLAYNTIVSKLKNSKEQEKLEKINELRKQAMEKGTIRTYNFQRGTVKNHENGKTAPLKKVLNGDINLLK